MEGGPQPRNSPAVLPWRCPQTGHGLGDRKVGLGREPARGHTLKFVGHAPGPIGAAAPASAPGSPKRPGGRPVRRFSLRLSAALAGCGETYALHKTELVYRNLAKSLKLAPFWCSYPLRQSPTGEVEKMI